MVSARAKLVNTSQGIIPQTLTRSMIHGINKLMLAVLISKNGCLWQNNFWLWFRLQTEPAALVSFLVVNAGVALTMALVNKPRVLLLDELLSAFALKLREKYRNS